MNLQELSRKYVEIDVKAMEDVLNFVRRRQRAEKELDDDFDYSILYEYILKEQEYIKMKIEEKAILEIEEMELKKERERTSVSIWLENEPKINGVEVRESYIDYVYWSKLKGYKPLSNVHFGKEIVKYGYRSKVVYKNGRSVRVYEPIEE